MILDVYRTALFIGRLHDTPYLRVIGVDGKVAYVNSGYEPDEMMAVLEAELAKIEGD